MVQFLVYIQDEGLPYVCVCARWLGLRPCSHCRTCLGSRPNWFLFLAVSPQRSEAIKNKTNRSGECMHTYMCAHIQSCIHTYTRAHPQKYIRTYMNGYTHIDTQTDMTLHYTPLHYNTPHHITPHYITLEYDTLNYITSHYIAWHYIT